MNYQRPTQPNHTFDFDSYGNYRHRRRYSLENNDDALDNSSFHFQTLGDYKRRSINSITTDSSSTVLLYGNSIVKSNKAGILNLLSQRSSTETNSKTFVNQYGVVISEDGPFWPCDYRILHPTPKLNTREVTPKEDLYSSVNDSSLKSKLTIPANRKRFFCYICLWIGNNLMLMMMMRTNNLLLSFLSVSFSSLQIIFNMKISKVI